MPELASDVAHSPDSRPSARRRVARRCLTGLSAAGMAAAIALTAAVSDASASPAANASTPVVTLTSSSSASTGHLTLRVKYQLEPRGRKKILSVTFAGASSVSLRHPALIFSLRPVPPMPFPGRPGQVRARAIGFSLILPLHTARSFSGALPAKVLAQIGKVFAVLHRRVVTGGFVLSTIPASVIRHRKQITITAPAGLQTGVLLGPVGP